MTVVVIMVMVVMTGVDVIMGIVVLLLRESFNTESALGQAVLKTSFSRALTHGVFASSSLSLLASFLTFLHTHTHVYTHYFNFLGLL